MSYIFPEAKKSTTTNLRPLASLMEFKPTECDRDQGCLLENKRLSFWLCANGEDVKKWVARVWDGEDHRAICYQRKSSAVEAA